MPLFSGDPKNPDAAQAAGSLIERLTRPYTVRDRQARITRALLYRDSSAASEQELGTHVPKPFSKSRLIYRYMNDVSDAYAHITNILSQNEPFFVVKPFQLPRGSADKAIQIAKDQQDLLNAEWWGVNRTAGRDLQRIVAGGQTLDGCGWYYTVPRGVDFGLPDRQFYEEKTDDEIEEMIRNGTALRETVEDETTIVEAADVWFHRRREQRAQDAIDGKTLFACSALLDPTIYVQWDKGGIGTGLIREELPATLFGPGSDLAELAAEFLGDPKWADLGIQTDRQGRITQGIPESDGQKSGLTLHKLFSRDAMAYVVSGSASGGNGRVIYHSAHQMGRVPLEPVPYLDTGEPEPERRYISALQGVFAYQPLINSAITFLTNHGAYSAFPRYVIETPETGYVDADGNPAIIERNAAIGLDPQEVVTIHGGTVKPLDVGDPQVLQNVVGIFLSQDQDVRPNDAERGAAANSSAAWSVRINDENSQRTRKAAQDHHAIAVENIGVFWIDMLRLLRDGKIGFLPAPGERSTKRKTRYVVEIAPTDLIRILEVVQSNSTIEEQAIKAQIGEARAAAGRIDDITLARDYYELPQPEQAALSWWIQRAFQLVMLGPNDQIAETSLLADIANAARGVAKGALTANSPAFAIEIAKAMAEEQPTTPLDLHPDPSGHQGSDDFRRGLGGPTSQAAGVRPPGMGAGVNQAQLPTQVQA